MCRSLAFKYFNLVLIIFFLWGCAPSGEEEFAATNAGVTAGSSSSTQPITTATTPSTPPPSTTGTTTSVLPPPPSTSVTATTITLQPNLTAAPMYRIYNVGNGDHLLTTDSTELGRATGYVSEGTAFEIFSYAFGTMTQPLYRCYNGRDHMVSNRSDCEVSPPYNREGGVYGYVYKAPWSSYGIMRPVHRCYNPWNGDHLTTTNPQECVNASYTVEHIQGYVK